MNETWNQPLLNTQPSSTMSLANMNITSSGNVYPNPNSGETVFTDSEASVSSHANNRSRGGSSDVKIITPDPIELDIIAGQTQQHIQNSSQQLLDDAGNTNNNSNNNNNLDTPHSVTKSKSTHSKSTVLTINEASEDFNREISNIKIVSWNVWGIPFGAPRTFTNSFYCSNYIKNLAISEKWDKYDGLIICGIQELWSWKTGIFPFFLLPILGFVEIIPCGLGYILSVLIQFVSILCGLIPPFKFIPYLSHNPKRIFRFIMRKYLPYHYSKSDIPCKHMLDNGLLLMSNTKPDECGMQGYKNMACDDSMAYKGFIWMYFRKKYNVLAITTHLQSAGIGKVRLNQVDELKEFIHKFTIEHSGTNENGKELKIIAFGDFNVDMTNHPAIMKERLKSGTREAKMRLNEIERKEAIDNEMSPNRENNNKKHKNNKNDKNNSKTNTTTTTTTASLKSGKDDSITNINLGNGVVVPLRHGMIQLDEALINALHTDTHGRRPSLLIERHRSYADLPMILGRQFDKINTFDSTHRRTHAMSGSGGCLDHIFVDFNVSQCNTKLLGQEDKLSDHLLTMATFECQ